MVTLEGESEQPFHHGAVTHADAEREAPARHLGERERGLGHRDRMAGIDRDDAHPEAEPRGGRPVRGEDEERVATEAVGDPDALVAERFGAPDTVDGGGEVTARDEVEGGTHQRRRVETSIASSPNACSRES